MRASPADTTAGRPSWPWPLDLTAYDRTPLLRDDERAALAVCQEQVAAGLRLVVRRRPAALERLTRPLDDVLTYTGTSLHQRREVAHFFLREMTARQSSFWGWTTEEWRALCRAPQPQFPFPRSIRYRQQVCAIAYLLCAQTDAATGEHALRALLAHKVFGQDAVRQAEERLRTVLLGWGYSAAYCATYLTRVLCPLLLDNRSPLLDDLTLAGLHARAQQAPPVLQDNYVLVSRALVELGILPHPLVLASRPRDGTAALRNVSSEWGAWAQRWRATSCLAPSSRESIYYALLTAGRWLAQDHPDVVQPAQWTRALALAYVVAVDHMTVGQWANRPLPAAIVGKPLRPDVKAHHLGGVRTFFRDCQDWGWIPRSFDPYRCLAVPRSIRALLGPDPRVIADDIWAKLLWAGLTLAAEDLQASATPRAAEPSPRVDHCYPLEMVRAVVLVWLFAGLRNDEIRRLRVGCVRWQRSHEPEAPAAAAPICLLDVPTNKTGTAFTKPVDHVVGEAIAAWEQLRPPQPALLDAKTGALVQYLFAYRGRGLGGNYVNRTAIPLLCRKGGLPLRDARGPITSHRARSTIASQLANAKDPMSLLELQQWLGHRSPASTQHYVAVSPTKLAQSYKDAGYFGRNIRTIEVLLDQEAITTGAAATGEPWKFYDLGHGYCTYDFFDQCPHRMACAKCSFYRPKGTSQAQLLEARANLQRMLQEIPLTEQERAAVEDGAAAMDRLCAQIADVPTPTGLTPRQLAHGQRPLPVRPPQRAP